MSRSHGFGAPAALILLLGFSGSMPARAAWAPGTVVNLGSNGAQPVVSAALLPASGTDFYVMWRFATGAGVANGVARLTGDGGVMFATQLDPHSELPGIASDGAGGLIGAFGVTLSVTNSDIAFRCLKPVGTQLPSTPATYFWAAQNEARDIDPTVATGPAGGAYIAWPAGPTNRYLLQRVTSTGARAAGWPAGGRVLPPADARSHPWCAPALLPDGVGGIYALAAEDVPRVWRVRSDTTLAPGWPALGLALGSGPYLGDPYPGSLALAPGAAGHTFAAWLESDGTQANVWVRVVVRSFSDAGSVDGPPLSLTPYTTGLASVAAGSDGQGGAFVSWLNAGGLVVAHIGANGELAGAPVAVTPAGVHGSALVPAHGGGFLAFWDEIDGIHAAWYTGAGALEPAEPENPKLVYPVPFGRTIVYPLTAKSDGSGGAYVVFDAGAAGDTPGPLAQIIRVADPATLDAPLPRPAALQLAASPNPARDRLDLTFALPAPGGAQLELLDVGGRRMWSRQEPAPAGLRHEQIGLPAGLPPGLYLVRLSQGAASTLRRIAVVR